MKHISAYLAPFAPTGGPVSLPEKPDANALLPDILDALRVLLEIAEANCPKYSHCDQIAAIEDLYKKLNNEYE